MTIRHDRIRRIRVQGLRTLDDFEIEVPQLTVLTGDSGTGKSSVIKALRLLHGTADENAAPPADFGDLLRTGSSEIIISCTISDGEVAAGEAAAGAAGAGMATSADGAAGAGVATSADGAVTEVEVPVVAATFDQVGPGDALEYTVAIRADQIIRTFPEGCEQRVANALESICVLERVPPDPMTVAARIRRLRQHMDREVWDEGFVSVAQLGLGDSLTAISLPDDEGDPRGFLLHFSDMPQPITARGLSTGHLAFLAVLAYVFKDEGRSIVAMDAPDMHLDSNVIAFLANLLAAAGTRTPILITTNSNTFLDHLPDPVDQLVLTVLDENRATFTRRMNPGNWSELYELHPGVGMLRAAGFMDTLFSARVHPIFPGD